MNNVILLRRGGEQEVHPFYCTNNQINLNVSNINKHIMLLQRGLFVLAVSY